MMFKRKKNTSPEDQKQLALHAKILSENMAFTAAFDAVKQAYTDKLLSTRVTDTKERDYYHICVNALNDVEKMLDLYLQNGKILEKELKNKARKYK